MKNHLLLIRLGLVVVAACSLITWVGCSTTSKRPPLSTELSRQDVTAVELGYQVFDVVIHFSRSVEQAADQMAKGNPDPVVRHHALLWKLNAIPAAYLATEHSDPLAMLVDIWSLCVQQTVYFESGAGKDLFGDRQAMAIRACRTLEEKVSDIAAKLVKPESFNLARQEILDWAEANPLRDHLFDRPSIVTMLAKAFPDRPPGIFRALDSLQAEMLDLKGRLALHMDHVPRQARWQAELLIDQVASDLVAAQLTNAFQLVAQERELILAAINRQRLETIEAIRTERIAALQSVSEQRVATLEETRQIMKETLAEAGRMVDAQREAVLQAVDIQRKATLAEFQATPLTLRHDVDSLVNATMDRAFGRILLLLGLSYVVLLGTALLGYILIRKLQRREHARVA